ASDAVIEVNPRHSRYYQRLLGFRQIGRRRQCRRLDAPVVLMHQELDDMSDQRS
ncbi:MAG: long-chain N-acyl amino acid synthase, partial [Propionivibrio sp.]|nr:long-chain N-acyl amino acid synthase [Candidatus Propionivibrio dominans]